MQELIKKIAENKELQAQLKGCKNAKTMAQLLGIDEALAEKLFPKLQAFLENGTLPDDLLDQASGGNAIEDADNELLNILLKIGFGGSTGGF